MTVAVGLDKWNAHRESKTAREEGYGVDTYVLIQTDGNNDSMVDALRAIPGVSRAEDLAGPYDAIALTRSATMDELTETVLRRIRELPGVIRALPARLIDQVAQDIRMIQAEPGHAA